ncbi:50S ribosomal protein L6, partial [bacterium]|nr:50S ribosomal protein L6 [bacterium]
MSRVGALPIDLTDGVEIKVGKQEVAVKGPKGSLARDIHPQIKVEVNDGQVIVQRPSDSKQFKSLHGLYRTLINNMVVGVTQGFQ